VTFVWDERKASANLRKHGVSFAEARDVFRDPLEVTVVDRRHSTDETRFFSMGKGKRGKLMAVSYTEQGGTIRIISVRKVTLAERRQYEEGS
jgi:uncharacterized DUF497 family protein